MPFNVLLENKWFTLLSSLATLSLLEASDHTFKFPEELVQKNCCEDFVLYSMPVSLFELPSTFSILRGLKNFSDYINFCYILNMIINCTIYFTISIW